MHFETVVVNIIVMKTHLGVCLLLLTKAFSGHFNKSMRLIFIGRVDIFEWMIGYESFQASITQL